MLDRHKMAEVHEAFLCRIFHLRRTRGSGNQANNPMDGRGDHYESTFAIAIDGKATMGTSLSITKAMWQKACEQAHGERPALGLRWYASERLRDSECLDLVVVSAHDLAEIIDRVNSLEDEVESLSG